MRGTATAALQGLKRPDLLQRSAYVNGAWLSKPETLSVIDLATGEELAQVAVCEASDVDDAVLCARAAFLRWRDMLPSERGEYLRAWATGMREMRKTWPSS